MSAKVLVVGAGPVGLAMGCELLRHGVSCRVIDKALTASDKSKALGVHARTLERLDVLGVADRFIAAGRKMHGTNAWADGKRVVHTPFDDIDSPYPFVLCLPQNQTERLLAEKFAELGGDIERGRELTALSDDGTGVRATFGGETARFDYLVGCDGAHSAVRHAVGISFDGTPYEEPFVLGDVRLKWQLDGDEIQAFIAADGMLACFPLPEDGWWRVVGDADFEPTLEKLRALLKTRSGLDFEMSEPKWMAPFRIQRRVASRYRVGRVFLAGDAAHIHSPVGGQGMNTGIQDAVNLAWKLALVDAGLGAEALLGSYEAERRPVGKATVTNTDVATRMVVMRNPVAREVRNRLMAWLGGLEVLQRRILATASETAIGYRNSPIVGGRGNPVRPGDRLPDVQLSRGCLFDALKHNGHTLLWFGEGGDDFIERARSKLAGKLEVVRSPGAAIEERLGVDGPCAMLVRPDGYVGYRGALDGLAAQLERTLS